MWIIYVVLFLFVVVGIASNIVFYKILRILRENNKGGFWDLSWKLHFSYRIFKEFIQQSDLDEKTTKEYHQLYIAALWLTRTLLILFFIFAYLVNRI